MASDPGWKLRQEKMLSRTEGQRAEKNYPFLTKEILENNDQSHASWGKSKSSILPIIQAGTLKAKKINPTIILGRQNKEVLSAGFIFPAI